MANQLIDQSSIHGENTYVELMDQYGLYQNITPYGLTAEEAVTAGMLSTSVMGQYVEAFQPGLSDGTAKFGAHWHAALDGIVDALVAAKQATTMRIYPNGH